MILFIIFVILLLILVNAFYVAAEFAAVSVRRNMIREMAEGGSKVAVHLLKILENTRELDRYIAACQFGITISSLILGASGQVQLSSYLLPLFERFGGPGCSGGVDGLPGDSGGTDAQVAGSPISAAGGPVHVLPHALDAHFLRVVH